MADSGLIGAAYTQLGRDIGKNHHTLIHSPWELLGLLSQSARERRDPYLIGFRPTTQHSLLGHAGTSEPTSIVVSRCVVFLLPFLCPRMSSKAPVTNTSFSPLFCLNVCQGSLRISDFFLSFSKRSGNKAKSERIRYLSKCRR